MSVSVKLVFHGDRKHRLAALPVTRTQVVCSGDTEEQLCEHRSFFREPIWFVQNKVNAFAVWHFLLLKNTELKYRMCAWV